MSQPMTKRFRILIFLTISICIFLFLRYPKLAEVDLDGIKMCVPREYAKSAAPFWVKYITNSLDNTYTTLLFYIGDEEIRQRLPFWVPIKTVYGDDLDQEIGVIVVNVSAISGLSQSGRELMKYVREDNPTYIRVDETEIFKIVHPGGFLQETWLVSSILKKDDINVIDFNQWMVGTCYFGGRDEVMDDCHIRKQFGELSYNYTIHPRNIKSRIGIENLIEEKIDTWKNNCRL